MGQPRAQNLEFKWAHHANTGRLWYGIIRRPREFHANAIITTGTRRLLLGQHKTRATRKKARLKIHRKTRMSEADTTYPIVAISGCTVVASTLCRQSILYSEETSMLNRPLSMFRRGSFHKRDSRRKIEASPKWPIQPKMAYTGYAFGQRGVHNTSS